VVVGEEEDEAVVEEVEEVAATTAASPATSLVSARSAEAEVVAEATEAAAAVVVVREAVEEVAASATTAEATATSLVSAPAAVVAVEGEASVAAVTTTTATEGTETTAPPASATTAAAVGTWLVTAPRVGAVVAEVAVEVAEADSATTARSRDTCRATAPRDAATEQHTNHTGPGEGGLTELIEIPSPQPLQYLTNLLLPPPHPSRHYQLRQLSSFTPRIFCYPHELRAERGMNRMLERSRLFVDCCFPTPTHLTRCLMISTGHYPHHYPLQGFVDYSFSRVSLLFHSVPRRFHHTPMLDNIHERN